MGAESPPLDEYQEADFVHLGINLSHEIGRQPFMMCLSTSGMWAITLPQASTVIGWSSIPMREVGSNWLIQMFQSGTVGFV